jgi:hypothetical protein
MPLCFIKGKEEPPKQHNTIQSFCWLSCVGIGICLRNEKVDAVFSSLFFLHAIDLLGWDGFSNIYKRDSIYLHSCCAMGKLSFHIYVCMHSVFEPNAQGKTSTKINLCFLESTTLE